MSSVLALGLGLGRLTWLSSMHRQPSICFGADSVLTVLVTGRYAQVDPCIVRSHNEVVCDAFGTLDRMQLCSIAMGEAARPAMSAITTQIQTHTRCERIYVAVGQASAEPRPDGTVLVVPHCTAT